MRIIFLARPFLRMVRLHLVKQIMTMNWIELLFIILLIYKKHYLVKNNLENPLRSLSKSFYDLFCDSQYFQKISWLMSWKQTLMHALLTLHTIVNWRSLRYLAIWWANTYDGLLSALIVWIHLPFWFVLNCYQGQAVKREIKRYKTTVFPRNLRCMSYSIEALFS